LGVKPRPKFGHGVVVQAGKYQLVCSYHPSQQNTFTGKLTEKMLDDVFAKAVRIAKK
jgi:uracil-DNA glycosylase